MLATPYGEVSDAWMRPDAARASLVLAHGAGAGMHHAFMEALTGALAQHGVATYRYQFPYLEQRKFRPDPPRVLEAVVHAAVARARALAPDLPLFAGGKSMGGRMTSNAAAHGLLDGVRGIVFFGFPLHPQDAPSKEKAAGQRAAHLDAVQVPMLFLQGARDALADLALLEPVVKRLRGRESAQTGVHLRVDMHVVPEANHAFEVPKRTGRTHGDVIEELGRHAARFFAEHAADAGA